MKDEIVFNDVLFSYGNKKILNKFNIKIKKGDFITVLGASGSGKTTISKILLGQLDYEGKLKINNNLEVVSFNCVFNYDTVLKNLKKTNKKDEIVNLLGIKDFLNYNPNYLSDSTKALIIIASSLIKDTSIIVFDDILTLIKEDMRKKIFSYLKKINKEQKTTIINITSNSEDSLYSKQIAIIKDGQVLKIGKTKDILSDEKLF